MNGLLIQLLSQMPLFPQLVLQSSIDIIQFVKLGILGGEILIQGETLAGQMLLSKHVVLHAVLHYLDGFFGVCGCLSAIAVLVKITECY